MNLLAARFPELEKICTRLSGQDLKFGDRVVCQLFPSGADHIWLMDNKGVKTLHKKTDLKNEQFLDLK